MFGKKKESNYSKEDVAELTQTPKCVHCGGWHAMACPRVKRMEFTNSGSLQSVEFWQLWDKSEVIFPQDVSETN